MSAEPNTSRDAHIFGEDIFVALYAQRDDEEAGVSTSLTIRAARNLMEQGYFKQRTITTQEELDALPVETVLRGSDGRTAEKGGRPEWWTIADEEPHTVPLPAIVLWEPKP